LLWLHRPLRVYFEALENSGSVEDLYMHFRPIMHLLLLVWKTSGYYNTSHRLVVVIREMCNTIIRQSKAYLDGEMIFELIEKERLKDITDMLQTTLRMIGSFKVTYFDYKVREKPRPEHQCVLA
jgi:dynein heavy chain